MLHSFFEIGKPRVAHRPGFSRCGGRPTGESRLAAAALAAACAAAAGCAGLGPRPAELVLVNGRILTMGSPARAEALAVRRGRIAFVGAEPEARAWIGAGTRLLDLEGKTVVPGFHDSHLHPVASGVELGECSLSGLDSASKVLERVRECAGKTPSGWLRGGGWEQPLFAGGNPGKALLDSIVADRPVVLDAADGHSSWVNSQALALAGIGKDTPDPPGGRVERDASGEPSGVLREAAMELVEAWSPPRGPAEYDAGLRRALAIAAAFGITTLHEASADKEILDAYGRAEARGELTARVNASFALEPSSGVAGARSLPGVRRRHRGKLLRLTGAKVFADGVLEARTAAVLEPYADRGGLGMSNWTAPELAEVAVLLDRLGFQLHVHAIGDRAVRMALDAIAEARRRNGPGGPPHQLAHLELIDPSDLPRFKALGVVADFQPLWAHRDAYIRDLTEPGLGPERSGRLYPLGGAVRAGADLACGSDWSVSSMNPLEAMQVAATRRGLDEGPGPAWLAAERLDAETLLRCYTAGGAHANLQDGVTGRLEKGFAADLVVLDRDPLGVPVEELGRVRVLRTFLEGRLVYSRPGAEESR